MDRVFSGMADLLRLEEEYSVPTEASLKQILNLMELDQPVNQVQAALLKIENLPKDPIKVGN